MKTQDHGSELTRINTWVCCKKFSTIEWKHVKFVPPYSRSTRQEGKERAWLGASKSNATQDHVSQPATALIEGDEDGSKDADSFSSCRCFRGAPGDSISGVATD